MKYHLTCMFFTLSITSIASEQRNNQDGIDVEINQTMNYLKSQQWTLPYFCTMVMTHTIPLLKGFVGYGGWISISSLEVFGLLCEISRIIDLSMPDDGLWTDSSILKSVVCIYL